MLRFHVNLRVVQYMLYVLVFLFEINQIPNQISVGVSVLE